MAKTLDEKVVFRMAGDDLAAFRERLHGDGITMSVFFRRNIADYLRQRPVQSRRTTRIDIPFEGCLKGEFGDYRDRAAEYVAGR